MSPECYCLTCLWEGLGEQLAEHPDGLFSCCPVCWSLDIVWLVD